MSLTFIRKHLVKQLNYLNQQLTSDASALFAKIVKKCR